MVRGWRAAVAALAAWVVAAEACGGSSSGGGVIIIEPDGGAGDGSAGSAGLGGTAGGGAGGGGGGGGTAGTSGAGGDPTTLAVRKFYLGDTTWSGSPSSTAWQLYGHDVDGQASTAGSALHCKLRPGATSSVKNDGPGGLDNSFGANLIPLFTSFAPNVSDQVNQSVESGEWTILLHLSKLGTAPDQDGIQGSIYGGGKFSPAPAWNGGDLWPIRHASVVGGDKSKPKATFPSRVAAGTWETLAKTELALDVSIQGYTFLVRITNARVTAKIAGTGPQAKASGATVSGVLVTEEVVDAMRKVAGAIDASLCAGSTFESIANQFRQASDILTDGTQDPAKTCDGISIGIGIDAVGAGLGAVLPPAPPPPDPCKP